jgi:NitT/TauT family transport system substrate-binding protein
VEIHDFQGGSKSLEALVSGSVDVVVGGYENTVLMQPKGLDLTAVVLLTNRFGLVLALTPTQAARYHSPSDLKGLRLGVTAPGSAAANALDIILSKGGLTQADVHAVGVGAGPSAVAAMRSGQIDGLVFSDPYITRLQVEGLAVPVIDSRQPEGQDVLYGGPAACSGAYLRRDTIHARPEAVQRFTNAMVRALRWIHTHDAATITAAMPTDFTNGAPDFYAEALSANLPTFTEDGRITAAEVARTRRAMSATGRLPSDVSVDLPRTYDPHFAESANHPA